MLDSRPARTLDPARRQAILDGALALVGEVGYDRVTMDAVAARAGASKATIYRWWDHKAALVADAMQCRHASGAALPDTGDIRQDLLSGLRSLADDLDLDVVAGLLTATRRDPELARLMREEMVTTKRASSRAWTRRCVERGLLPDGADGDLFHELGPAMIFMRLLVTGEPVDDAFLTRVVDDVLLPLLQRTTSD